MIKLSKDLTIAIDGYSSCGKSTLAKDLAKELDYIYIDSGAMYRAVTFFAMQKGWIQGCNLDKNALIPNISQVNITFARNSDNGNLVTMLNGSDVEEHIRVPEVAAMVSHVAAIPEVRKHLVKNQRKMGESGRIVMDGRDIGTVVFPEADVKFFMQADPDIRAKRRLQEMDEKGIKASFSDIRSNLLERDRLDETRKDSPLRKAPDSIIIDTSYLSRCDQLSKALEILRQRFHEH